MVVALVLLTFGALVVVGLLHERRRKARLLFDGDALHDAIGGQEPNWVAGFKVPSSLSYHQGHTWVHWVNGDQAYIGIDDFARRLIGQGAKTSPPAIGSYVEQGEKAFKISKDGQPAWILSPVAGEIVGVNPRIKDDPDVVYREPYGRGWIYKVKSPRLFKDLANLLKGSLAERWIEDTRGRFQHRLMVAHGSVIQDGGFPVDDIGAELGSDEWRSLVDEFLTLNR